MGAIRLFQKLLDYLQRLFDGIAYRREKKFGAVHGDDRSVKSARKKISIAIIGAFVLVLFAVTVREGVFLGSGFFLEREIPSAPRENVSTTDRFNQTDIDLISRASGTNSGVDCSALSLKLRQTGVLAAEEETAFLKSCVPSLDKNTAEVISKVLSNDMPPDVAQKLLGSLDAENATQMAAALDNPEVIKSLKEEGGLTVAESITTLGRLSPEEAASAAKIIANTPPQYRAASLAAIKDIGSLSDADARKSLFGTLSDARSPDEIASIKAFAREAKGLTPDEQRLLSESFAKIKSPEARRAIVSSVKELQKLDKDDPARGRLVEALTAIPGLAPEQQATAAASVGRIARAYAEEKNPERRQAIADAISSAKDPESVTGLANRLDTVKQIGGLPISDRDYFDFVSGRNPNTVSKINSVAEATRKGATDDAKQLMSGDLLPENTKYGEAAGDKSKPTASESPTDLKAKLQKAEEDLAKTRAEIKKTEIEVINLKSMDLPPTDTRVVTAYGRLAAQRAEEQTRVAAADAALAALRAKAAEVKSRAAEEFLAMGVAMPEIVLPASKTQIANDAPEVRLSDLKDVPGFYSVENAGKKPKKLQFGEISTVGASTQGSLMKKSLAGMPKTWVVSGVAGASGQTDKGRIFEMSRTQFAPGVMMRIPPKGIPSDKASKYTLFFKFLGSVAERRTGTIMVPAGSIAMCKVQDFDTNTGKLAAKCDKIDIGGSVDIDADITLCDADGSDGLTGAITDNRGWYLAGVFLTAFTAAVLDGYSQSLIAPYEAKTQQTLGDYTARGSISGVSLIARDVADKQIEEWQKAPYFWHSFDGALASVRQN